MARRRPPTYPIVLAHGIARFDRPIVDAQRVLGGIKALFETPGYDERPTGQYFNGVAEALTAEGFQVHRSNVAWADSVKVRSAQLREYVEHVLTDCGAPKVNIIAHSMGGLDARHMMFDDRDRGRIHARVASLTTIGTPHRGTAYADAELKTAGDLVDVLKGLALNAEGFRDLTRQACARFNEDPAVIAFEDALAQTCELRAYTGRTSRETVMTLLTRPFDVISQAEGPNDGLVSVESALWSRAIETGVWEEVDHMNELAWGDVRQHLRHGETNAQLARRIQREYVAIARRLPGPDRAIQMARCPPGLGSSHARSNRGAGAARKEPVGHMKKADNNALLHILSKKSLDNLRAGYDLDDILALARAAINGPFELAQPWGAWAIDSYFAVPRKVKMSPRERQRTCLAMFVEREPPLLGIHIYWSLCCEDPLDPEDIAESLLLASNYRGIDLWNRAAQTLKTALTALEAAAKDGPIKAVDAAKALDAAFKGVAIDVHGGKK